MECNPCFGCEQRQVGCHASCEKHKAWSKAERARKDLANKNKKLEQEVLDAPFMAFERAKKERKRK